MPSSLPSSSPTKDSRSILSRSGLVIVDKPAGMTSHDVVARLRRLYGTRKIGHSGTLDPMATGVLIVGIERGTRFLAHVVTHDKRYEATIRLGTSTLTDDAEGETLTSASPESLTALTEDRIRESLAEHSGNIMQRPSSVSSIKINGRRAHELVREGVEVILPERPVTIFSLEVDDVRLSSDYAEADIRVHCSSGTYIRSIARDIGESLGVGGHLTALRRTSVGPFDIAEARTLEALSAEATETPGHGTPALSLTLDEAMVRCFPVREVTEDQGAALSLGKWLEPEGRTDVVAAVTPSGHAIALLAERGSRAASVFVARPAGLK